ncbi:MAG: hypothetical protein PHX20_08145 [Candidatus Omnitrophica bacterium]|nr:hypothetical protein [Candidatus Omnitrophota bacterium]MDD5437495.1 hypothetical protein [Candidatus Omnitrophota bacterium]
MSSSCKIPAILSASVFFLLVFQGAACGELKSGDGTGRARAAEHVSGEMLVKFRDGADPRAVLEKAGIRVNSIERVFSMKPGAVYEEMPEPEKALYRNYRIKLAPGVDVDGAVRKLKKDPDVEHAGANYIMKTLDGPQ